MSHDLPPRPLVFKDWASSSSNSDEVEETQLNNQRTTTSTLFGWRRASFSFSRSRSRSVNRDSSDRTTTAPDIVVGNNGLPRISSRGCIRRDSSDNIDTPGLKKKELRRLFSGLSGRRSTSLTRGLSVDDDNSNIYKPARQNSGIRNLFRRRSSLAEKTNQHPLQQQMTVNPRGSHYTGGVIGVPELYYQPLSKKMCYRDKLVRTLGPTDNYEKLCVLGQDGTCIRLSNEVINSIMKLDMPFFINPSDLDGPSETWDIPVPFEHPINNKEDNFDKSSISLATLELWEKYSMVYKGGTTNDDGSTMPSTPEEIGDPYSPLPLPVIPPTAIASEVCSDLKIFLKGCERIRKRMLDISLLGNYPLTKWGVEVISSKNKIFLNRLLTINQPFREHEIAEVLRELELTLRNLNDVQLLLIFMDAICNETNDLWSGPLSVGKRSFRDQVLRLLPTAVFLRCIMMGIDPVEGQSRTIVHQGFSEACGTSEKWDLEAQKSRSIFAPDEMVGRHIETLESNLHSLLKSVTADKGWSLIRRFGTEIIFINGLIELIDPEHIGEFADVEWWSLTVDVQAPKQRGIYYNCLTHQVVAINSKRKFHYDVYVVAKDPTNIDPDTYRWSAVPANDFKT